MGGNILNVEVEDERVFVQCIGGIGVQLNVMCNELVGGTYSRCELQAQIFITPAIY